jgi:zinc protease
MMNQFLFIHDYGLPDDYLSRYVKTVQNVTPEELRSLAIRYLDWESMNVIEVG